MQSACAVLSSATSPALQNFFYFINGTFFGRKLLNTKCVFLFSLQLLSETFLILRRIQQDMIMKMHVGLQVKYRYSCSILITLGVSGQIFENYTYIKFHETLSTGSRVVPCGRTDIQGDMTKLIVAFRSFANAPKNRARTKPKIQNKNEAVQFTDNNNYYYYYYCYYYCYYYYYYYCYCYYCCCYCCYCYYF